MTIAVSPKTSAMAGPLSSSCFFVLSGFVISHSARPELGLRTYALHCIAWIYPVVWAVALMSMLIAQYVPINIMNYGSRNSDWMDIALNLLFLGQSWTDLPMPYVGTIWSLDYEIWYYFLLGLWMYYPNWKLLACAALIAGPEILLLQLVWLLGVVLHRLMFQFSHRRAACLFWISASTALLFIYLGLGIRIREALRLPFPEVIELAGASNQFAGNFLLGLVVALNFLAAGSLRMELLLKFKRVIRYLSGFTFSLYIFHLPLAVLIWNGFQIRSVAPFFSILLAGVWVLGMLTEQRGQWYRAFFGHLLLTPGKNVPFDTETAKASN